MPLLYAAARFGDQRDEKIRPYQEEEFPLNLSASGGVGPSASAGKRYTIWDAYLHADFVTYPSLYEGFGNAFLETIYFRLPLLVNRYPIYKTDIAPLGFKAVEISGGVTSEAEKAVIRAMMDPVYRREIIAWNYHLAREHFSYEAVQLRLERLIDQQQW